MNCASDYSANMQGIGALSGAGMQACEARQSAKGRLRDRIKRLRREADQLEALCKALPEELPAAAEDALWGLATR